MASFRVGGRKDPSFGSQPASLELPYLTPIYLPNPTGADTTAIQSAITKALNTGRPIQAQPGTYTYSQLSIDMDGLGVSFPSLVIRGGGSGLGGTRFTSDGTQAIGIYCNASASGNTKRLRFEDLMIYYTAGGMSGAGVTSILMWNVLHATVTNCLIYGDRCALSIQGSGATTINNTELYLSGPVPASPQAPLWIGCGNTTPNSNDGTLTSSGPVIMTGGQVGSGSGTPAIILDGRTTTSGFGAFSNVFIGTQYGANGGSQVGSITVDGWATTATFIGCHGESNYNNANSASDFVIGQNATPRLVSIRDHIAWGHGNGTNYQNYFVDLYACQSFTFDGGILSKLGHAHGYDSGIVHFRSSYPATGAKINVRGVDQGDTAGPMYADDNGNVPTTYTGPYQRPSADQTYKSVVRWATQFNAATYTAATTAILGPVDPSVGGARADGFFYFDPTQYQTPPGAPLMLRLRAMLMVNATAPTCNFTPTLVPASGSPSGGAGAVSWNNGSSVTGSNTQTFTAPAAGSNTMVVTADFAAPTAGWYALGCGLNAAMAASSAVAIDIELQAHCVG